MATEPRLHDSHLRFVGSWQEAEKALLREAAREVMLKLPAHAAAHSHKPWIFTHQSFGTHHFYFAQWLHRLETVLVADSACELAERMKTGFRF